MTWRVNREAILFLAAGRALLLQLAHPWVAAAVADIQRPDRSRRAVSPDFQSGIHDGLRYRRSGIRRREIIASSA
jgi:uncharacterized protein (DUF2236 family)